MAVPGYVLKHKRTTLERAEKFISRTEWTDCNLFGRLYKAKAPVCSIVHYAAPGRITYTEAVKNLELSGTSAKIGQAFGPTWATHWFKVEYEIPAAWEGEEVRFVWNSNSEAMIWVNGKPMQGFTNENRRNDYILTDKFQGQAKKTVYIEMACNELFGAGVGGQINPPDLNKMFTVETVELALPDLLVFQLFTDCQVIVELAKKLPENSNRAYQALYTVNHMVNTVVLDNRASYQEAHDIAKKFFTEHNGATQHVIHAIGNCHIDSAWLWPYAETIRKCARSFSSTIRLLEKYPDFKFACSQAQQFEWVKTQYPALYEDIKVHVKAGGFIPVGGVWIEMDGLMPSGEACMRQFLYGQRFFEKEFGFKCKEFWLPDTFGYSGQLPQIMRHVGIERFLTQKLSWNLINKFPHHSFYWHGIDDSAVLAHFPPGDSYTMRATADELLHSLDNFKDKGRSNASMFLYGYGDGGQGPTADMIERLRRLEDVDGCPKVTLSSPDAFFTEVETYDSENLCHWSGELYLELHNGTYTSQAKTKNGNRRCEFLLQRVEAVATVASLTNDTYTYPRSELDRLWKLLLLNQFHDVLPGTSINAVYKDALAYYKDITKTGTNLLNNATKALFKSTESESAKESLVVNTQGWQRTAVIAIECDTLRSPMRKKAKNVEDATQIDFGGNTLALVAAPSYGYSLVQPITAFQPVVVQKGDFVADENLYIRNQYLEATIDSHGRLVDLRNNGCNKNAIAPDQFGNQLVIFDDVPLYWDAWDVMDYHLETRRPIEDVIQQAMIIEDGPLRGVIEVSLKISDVSLVKQYIILDAACPYLQFKTEVCWHESHKFLKVEFPVNVLSQQATYEIAYGHLQRPTHFNTSWDWAKYEVCGHKWADVSEHGFGVAVLNDNKYGWSCINNVLRLSLLRAPKAPDEKADMGTHHFTYAVMPHPGTFQEAGVIQAAYELNNPLTATSLCLPEDTAEHGSYFSVDTPQIVLDTVKMAEDSEREVILRLYEAFGGRTTATITTTLPIKQAHLCNGLEEIHNADEPLVIRDRHFSIEFKPFQIQSVVLKF